MRYGRLPALLVSLITIPLTFAAPPAQSAQFVSDFNNGVAPGSSVQGNASVLDSSGVGNSGVLRLTSATGGQNGAYYIDDFAGGSPVSSFKATFRLAIGGGTARPADGMAFSFGTDLSGGLFGEDGTGNGITVSFDTWDNQDTGDSAPAIELRFGGAVVATQYMSTGGAGNPFREGGRAPGGPLLMDGAGNPVNLQTYGPGPAVATDSSYVNVLIQLFDDNTVSVSYSNVVVFDHVAIAYSPLSGGRFAFGARTGGATENHLIDNLQIFANFTLGPATLVTPPEDQSVNETTKATFSIAVDGTPPFFVKWFSNNVAIPGADQLVYTTPPATLAMEGVTYKVVVTNAESVTPIQGSAVLHVIPALLLQSASNRNLPDKVFVVFSKPVTRLGNYFLNPPVGINSISAGATPNEVVLSVDLLTPETTYTLTVEGETGTDGSTLRPDPSSAVFHFGFGAFCHDFNDNVLPPGSTLAGATITDGAVHLTEAAVGGACGAYFVADQLGGAPLDRLQVRWRSLVGRGNGGGADGYSFNWAPDVAAAGTCSGSEEGSGTGLSVTVDTFDNGGGEAPGVEIKWKGNRVAFAAIPKDDPGNGVYLRKGQFVDASVEVLPNGNATFNYDGTVITATLPQYAPIAGGNFLFVGRTGGATDDQWIDDLRINCFSLGPPVFATDLTDTTVVERDTATLVVDVEAAPPLTLQWYTNNVAVPGAITSRYTTPVSTPALEGIKVYVVAANEFGSTTSKVATLHFQPAPRLLKVFAACEDTVLHVIFSKGVMLNGTYAIDAATVTDKKYGSNNLEVILTIDLLPAGTPLHLTITDEHDLAGNPIFPNPATATFVYSFGPICTDFSALPSGGVLGGAAALGADGILHLTDAHVNGVCGSLFIPDQYSGTPLDRLHATWKSRIGGGDSGADGFSFNWGGNLNSGSGCAGAAEEGVGNGLSVAVDTFDNGAPTDVGGTGIQIKWNGAILAFAAIPKDPDGVSPTYLRKDAFVDVQVDVLPTGLAQFTYDGVTITGVIPNFSGVSGGGYVLVARTGGANDNHWVDDLCINSLIPDESGPVIVVPSQVVVDCTGVNTPVNFVVTAFDFCEGFVNVNSTPASGSNFPIGSTTVTSTASDGSGHTTTRTFAVVVKDKTAQLTITRSGSNVIVRWPQTCTSYTLESGAVLGEWSTVGVAPVPVGTDLQVTLPIGTGNQFFRLHHQ